MTVYTGCIGYYSKTNGPIIVSQPKVGDKFMKVKLFEPFRAKWTTNKTHGTVCIQRKSKLNQRSKYSYRLAEQSHRYCINCSHERRESSRNDNKINFILLVCIFFTTGEKERVINTQFNGQSTYGDKMATFVSEHFYR